LNIAESVPPCRLREAQGRAEQVTRVTGQDREGCESHRTGQGRLRESQDRTGRVARVTGQDREGCESHRTGQGRLRESQDRTGQGRLRESQDRTGQGQVTRFYRGQVTMVIICQHV
jgi:hypothetical protein